jgi:hypothetical protein
MFAVVNAVLLKPLPFKDADRLMLVRLLAPDLQAGPGVYREVVWSYPKYRTFLDVQHSFEDAALFGGRDYSLSGDGDPERVRGEVVTDRFPTILGIAPILGRTFTYDEANRAGAQPVVMIGHGLWTRRYTILAKRRNDVPEAEAMAGVGVNGGQVDAQYRQDAAGLTRIGASMIGFDATTLLFTCLVTVVTAVIVGLLPALHASSLRPSEALKTGTGGAGTRGFRGFSARARTRAARGRIRRSGGFARLSRAAAMARRFGSMANRDAEWALTRSSGFTGRRMITSQPLASA